MTAPAVSLLAVKVKMAGVAVVAAALAGGGLTTIATVANSDPAPDDMGAAGLSTTPTPTPEVGGKQPKAQRRDATAEPNGSAVPTPPPCTGEERNHGEYVSGVAKSTPRGTGASHGAVVSQAAKSDCGKDEDTSADNDEAEGGDKSTTKPKDKPKKAADADD